MAKIVSSMEILPFSFQKILFSTTCYVLLDRNDLISSTVVVKKPFRPLQIVL